jgi:hypothetical protein
MAKQRQYADPRDWQKAGPRPKAWHFRDPIEHQLHTWSMRARSQALYRGEAWTMTDREYIDLWLKDDQYQNRGRALENLCMTRIDPEGAWSMDNVAIITRELHYKTCHAHKKLKNIYAHKEAI